MVRTETNTQKINDLYTRLTDPSVYGPSGSIEIASDFQRGDEETGVWDAKSKMNYIDSLRKQYPAGILTFVRAFRGNQPLTLWQVLDGGNRCRGIRDFKADTLTKKFTDLSPQEQAAFDTESVSCQWITIEANDPPDTISTMYCRLNMTAKPLSQGELFKAHGWMKDVWELEMAKSFLGNPWASTYNDERIPLIRTRWCRVIGDLGETERCDNLAMMTAYIISARTGKLTNFDKRYKAISGLLSTPGTTPTSEEVTNIFDKFNDFLDVLEEIGACATLGKSKCGIKPRNKMCPIWMHVCGEMESPARDKLIRFYRNIALEDTSAERLRKGYVAISARGGNNEISPSKLDGMWTHITQAVLL